MVVGADTKPESGIIQTNQSYMYNQFHILGQRGRNDARGVSYVREKLENPNNNKNHHQRRLSRRHEYDHDDCLLYPPSPPKSPPISEPPLGLSHSRDPKPPNPFVGFFPLLFFQELVVF